MRRGDNVVRLLPKITLPTAASSVAEARHRVRDFLAGAAPAQVLDDANLMTSELASNAVLHDGGWYSVGATVSRERVRVEVDDNTARLPILRRVTPDAVNGRGMSILDALATRWGADPTPTGKRVWFEIDLDEPR
jgi:anti-sigma regulatory factor (Ser/Thr protein kinase)